MPELTSTEYTLLSAPGASVKARAEWKDGVVLPTLLFFATLFTTAMVGARFQANFEMGLPPLTAAADLVPISWILQNPARLLMGLPFSLTVLSILLAHELGHYYACRRHGVESSLPYFLPAPTLSGTAGAIIRLKTRVTDRRALLDIGVSGPICGFLLALPLTLIGLLLSQPSAAVASSAVNFHSPVFVLLNGIVRLVHPGWPGLSHLIPHPMLIGCWIGMFVTFLNLLPGGQLDGGHILYAIAPRIQARFTHLLSFLLLLAGIFFWMGWLLWAVVLMLPFMRHPKIQTEPELTRTDRRLAFAGFLMLALTFMAQPFHGGRLMDFFH